MDQYIVEEFSPEELEVLASHFTNVSGPVAALFGLDPVVCGALFARYSRSDKSLRRLFLDEFASELETAEGTTAHSTGRARAERLYAKVLDEYGDDSVAQLGSAHLACEQVSNLLTKELEWGRLASYLEQSTRYIAYDTKLGGRWRYFRSPEILSSAVGARYCEDLDGVFVTYRELLGTVTAALHERYRRQLNEGGEETSAWKRALRGRALDAVRGVLPAATLSNVGVYASGQGFEQLVLRLRASELPEARLYGDLAARELEAVIGPFLRRLDRPDRGGAWVSYLEDLRRGRAAITDEMVSRYNSETGASQIGAGMVVESHLDDGMTVTLTDFDRDGEDKVLAAVLYATSSLSQTDIKQLVSRLSAAEKERIFATAVGDRQNRRHKPGRAFEVTNYRFDIVCDYGAFRDLQRHRMCSIEWQPLSVAQGFVVPEDVIEANAEGPYREAMDRSAGLYEALGDFGPQAGYAVALGYRVRFALSMNAREAFHLIELRSQPQGHLSYRRVAWALHDAIRDVAGHRLVAAAMEFVVRDSDATGRLSSERRRPNPQ